jgi:hypothetical protein
VTFDLAHLGEVLVSKPLSPPTPRAARRRHAVRSDVARQAVRHVPRSGGNGAYNQPVAILHQSMAHEAEFRLLASALAVEAGIGIGVEACVTLLSSSP